MPTSRRRLRDTPLVYPLLLAAYPVLFLWAHNREESVEPTNVLGVLIWVMALTLGAWALGWIVFRDAHRASFAAAALVAPFLFFGHVQNELEGRVGDPEAVVFVGGLALMVIGLVVAWRARWVSHVARIATPVLAILLIINVVPLAGALRPDPAVAQPLIQPVPLPTEDPAHRPDVYYLIFDRYASERVLDEQFGFDNAPFLNDLRGRGFSVVDDAVANYPRTTPSLASSLNMMYLDELAERLGPDSVDWGAMNDYIDRALVPTTFERLGYRTVNIGSWWNSTSHDPGADENISLYPSNEFSFTFWNTTMWPTLSRTTRLARDDAWERGIWETTPEQFGAVADVAEDAGPTFTFAHFLVPHPPEVFRADGSYAGDGTELVLDDAYLEQVRYTNTKILELLDEIVGGAAPGEEPIVVIQADEGPYPDGLIADEPNYDFYKATQADMERKQMILEALYLPGHPDAVPTFLTPVNTFRLILATYFDAELALVPNRAFVLRDNRHPYELHEVTDRLILPPDRDPGD